MWSRYSPYPHSFKAPLHHPSLAPGITGLRHPTRTNCGKVQQRCYYSKSIILPRVPSTNQVSKIQNIKCPANTVCFSSPLSIHRIFQTRVEVSPPSNFFNGLPVKRTQIWSILQSLIHKIKGEKFVCVTWASIFWTKQETRCSPQ